MHDVEIPRPRRRPAPHALALACLTHGLLAACSGGETPTDAGEPPVEPPTSVARVDVTPDSLALEPGETATITAIARAADGRALSGVPASWRSDAPAVATVSSTGRVSAVAAGSARIVAIAGGREGTATVVVTASFRSLTITPAAASLRTGDTLRLTALALDAQGASRPVAPAWRSRSPAIVSVDGTGLVTAVATGAATVEAREGSLLATAEFLVQAAAPAAPADLIVTGGRRVATLSWTLPDSEVRGVVVERWPAPTPDEVRRDTLPPSRRTFADSVTTGRWVYRVGAFTDGAAARFTDTLGVEVLPAPGLAVAELTAMLDAQLDGASRPLDGRDLGAELLVAAEALADHPDVFSVYVHAPSATGHLLLRDGSTIVLVNNGFPTQADRDAESALRTPLARQPLPRRSARRSAPAAAIPSATRTPGRRRAGTVSIGGGEQVVPLMADILRKADFDVEALGGTVEAMRAYRGLGALYFDTHSAPFNTYELTLNQLGLLSTARPTGQRYAFETETVLAPADLALYAEEIAAGEIVAMIVPKRIRVGDTGLDLPLFDAKLGITDAFIRKHWQLEDAVVVLHSCFSGASAFGGPTNCFGQCNGGGGPPLDPTVMRDAVAAAGASAMIGYDNYVWPTSSYPSMSYFVDRLIGASSVAPIATPPRRPFDLASVQSAMQDRGLLQHAKGARTVNALISGANDAYGRPSIARAEVRDEAETTMGTLEIEGGFGSRTGTVRVDDITLTVRSWSGTRIIADLPVLGPGSSGPLIVEVPGGLESNEVPLTEWSGRVSIEALSQPGPLVAEAEIELRFRGDAHAIRRVIERDARPETFVSHFSPASEGTVTGYGTRTNEGGSTLTYSGTRPMRLLTRNEVDMPDDFPAESVFGGVAEFQPAQRTLRLCLFTVGEVTGTNQFGDRADILALYIPLDAFDSTRGFAGCVSLPIGDDLRTSRVVRTGTAENYQVRVTFGPFTPSIVPTPETPG